MQLQYKLHSVAIQVSDFDSAYRFYRDVLGLPVVREPYTFKNRRTLAWLGTSECLIELFSIKTGETSRRWESTTTGPINISLEVEDLEGTLKELQSRGAHILRGPYSPPSGDPGQPDVALKEGPEGEDILIREPAKRGSIVP